jgi:cytochrome c oxidase assembly protein subunit 15
VLESRSNVLHLPLENALQGMQPMSMALTAQITSQQALEAGNRKLVRRWLYIGLLVIFALVLVGGATRLTDSGLSITEWKPIHGVIPPLSEAEWQEEFLKYQQIPEYQTINKGMTIDAFKSIFWWEWAHRLLARATGFVFAIPLAFFWLTGRLEAGLKPRLLGILALGGIQGFIGWWMVSSGLTERTDVSQYRLATHLVMASLIFAATTWVARGLAEYSQQPAQDGTRRFAGFLVLMVLVQIYLGALVAGLDAGLAYNTWPLMDGAWIPSDLWNIEPAWRNAFESPKTVQFIHRSGAYLLFALALIHMARTMATEAGSTHARRSVVLFLLVTAQAAIGITTLLMMVQMHVALLHQGMALIVLFFAVAHWRAAKGPYHLPTEVSIES